MIIDRYADRSYRSLHSAKDLAYFRVSVGESDLHIGAKKPLFREALPLVHAARRLVEEEIAARPRFQSSLVPIPAHGTEAPLILRMLQAGELAGVGPMAAVAGAIAEEVGRALLPESSELIVENGGDIFLYGSRERSIEIFAGSSPLSGLLALSVLPKDGLGVCTSSGTIGHSLSFGCADAAVVLARDCALADAAATRLGNLLTSPERMEAALDTVCSIRGVLGALVIFGDRLALKGELVLKTVSA